MSLHKLTAGDGYRYLTRQVAAADTDRGRQTLGGYYEQRGESPGRWWGRGLGALGIDGVVSEAQMVALFGEGRHPDADRLQQSAIDAGASSREALEATRLGRAFAQFDNDPVWRVRLAQAYASFNLARGSAQRAEISVNDRAAIRSEVARALFTEEHGRSVADGRELSGFIARHARPERAPVAGYDLTFSPVKSVSALWAVAPRQVSEAIAAAHDAAVAHTIGWLESNAVFSRQGSAGVRQVDVDGLIAAVFVHRDSRAGDPDLHTHVAISNKVRTLDGHWLALDGRVLYKANVAASERYNTRLEVELGSRLGLRFAARASTDLERREVREIVGVDPRLNAEWSTRRASIDGRRAELNRAFQLEHGRPPTASEAIALAEQANLETREAKHEPRSYAAQREVWRSEAERALGPKGVDHMVDAALHGRPPVARELGDAGVESLAAGVVETVSKHRATWQVWHLQAEAQRQVRSTGRAAGDVDALVARVVAASLRGGRSVELTRPDPVSEPAPLRRRDGESVYSVHGSKLYSSPEVLGAERRIVVAGARVDGRRADPRSVDTTLLEQDANGLTLNTGQAVLVRELVTSGARVQLALAPAGTGKTTAMKALAAAWIEDGGDIVGLAPSAAAASELATSIGARADTLDKLVWHIDHPDVAAPQWVSGIGVDSLVIVDEAGMASTANLDRAIAFALDRGASVRLVGDDRQLASVAAGGVLRDLQSAHGAATLTEVVRFSHPAEGPASLAMRSGDPSALGFYLDHARVHAGTPDTVLSDVYADWQRDRAAGRDSIMLAPRREQVTVLNTQARADRIAALGDAVGPALRLGDGSELSAGDTVMTRRNDRSLPLGQTDFVRNGYRWNVRAVTVDGGVDVVHLATGRSTVLPPAYVGEWVRLGYASTIHGAQGVTVDTAHTVVDPAMSNDLLYVGMTRGRAENHAHVPVVADGGEHEVIRPETLSPPTAAETLAAIIARDGSQTSATTAASQLADPRVRLAEAAARYADAVHVAAENVVGPDDLARMTAAAEALVPGVSDAEAWPTLRGRLALREAESGGAVDALRAAVGSRSVDGAYDMAALIDWRLTSSAGGASSQPLPWLPAIDNFRDDQQWGPYLGARAALVTELCDEVRGVAGRWADQPAGIAPLWAQPLLAAGADVGLLQDLAVWRATARVDDADLRVTGPRQISGDAAAAQAALIHRVEEVEVIAPSSHAQRWRELSDAIGHCVDADPYWPVVAERLTAMDAAGVYVEPLLRSLSRAALPDEQPAAALWWRLTEHVSPDIGSTPMNGRTTPLEPSWQPSLVDALGAAGAAQLQQGAMWPALVARVDAAVREGWDVGGLFVVPFDERGPVDALAMVWRVSMLADPSPVGVEHLPPDPADAEAERPHDIDEVDQDENPRAWWHTTVAATGPSSRHTSDGLVPVGLGGQLLSDRVSAAQTSVATARANLAAQLQAVRTGEATHTKATRPEVLRLRAEADRLAPYVAEVAFAAADIIDAEVDAVHGPAPAGRHDLTRAEQVTPDVARARYVTAAAALAGLVGPDGIVRHEDVDTLGTLARELDDGVTAALRATLQASTDGLLRVRSTSVEDSEADRVGEVAGPVTGTDWGLEHPAIDGGALNERGSAAWEHGLENEASAEWA